MKTLRVFLGALLLLGVTAAVNIHRPITYPAPGILWSKQIGSTGDDVCASASLDANGNLCVAGTTTAALFGNHLGKDDVFAAKYSPEGAKVWGVQFGSSAKDLAEATAVDAAGNLYILGTTDGSFPGRTNAGDADIFLVKLSSRNGAILWQRQLGTYALDVAGGITLDSGGNVFIVGTTYGGMFGIALPSDKGSMFVAKYDSGGQQVWGKQYDASSGFILAGGVSVDAQGNIYVAGEASEYFDSSRKSQDAFIAKYDASGNRIWGHQFGTDNMDGGGEMCLIPSGIYVSGGGDEGGGVDADGPGTGFLARYTDSGSQTWLKWLDYSNSCVNALAIDKQENAYVAGTSNGNLYGASLGKADAFVAKYDPYGSVEKGFRFGTASDDSAVGIMVSAGGDVHVVGCTDGNLYGTNAGKTDTYIVKFAPMAKPKH